MGQWAWCRPGKGLEQTQRELELRYNMTESDNKSVSDNIDTAMKEYMSGSKMAKCGKLSSKAKYIPK